MSNYIVTYKYKGKETIARVFADDAKEAEDAVLSTFRSLGSSVEFISATLEKRSE